MKHFLPVIWHLEANLRHWSAWGWLAWQKGDQPSEIRSRLRNFFSLRLQNEKKTNKSENISKFFQEEECTASYWELGERLDTLVDRRKAFASELLCRSFKSKEKKIVPCFTPSVVNLCVYITNRRSPGLLAVGGPSWAGVLDHTTSRGPFPPPLLWFCDSVSNGGQCSLEEESSLIFMVVEKKELLNIQDWISLLSFVTYHRIRQYIWIIFSSNQRKLFSLC